jgi:hypothetical protein
MKRNSERNKPTPSPPRPRDGVDADVHQHLDTFGCAQRHRMPGGRQGNDLAVAPCHEHRVRRIDRQAVSDHLLREYRSGTRSSGQTWPERGDRI